MKAHLYFIDCITNLHVGSGDINFNIVDKEVEKDPINEYPIIHASGIKGALRDHAAKSGIDTDTIDKVFGSPCTETDHGNGGSYHFFNAELIYRPMRAFGKTPCINVTTVKILENFKNLCESFGLSLPNGLSDFNCSAVKFKKDVPFLVSDSEEVRSVEGDEVAPLDSSVESILSKTMDEKIFALVDSFDDYDLPVIARNNLQIASGGLWYEEYVPRGSRFYMVVLTPDDDKSIDMVIPSVAQIGGNASIGYGYCKFTKIV